MPVIVLSLRRKTRASTGTPLARKARMRDGNVASRPAPLMKPAPFQLERDVDNIFLGEKAGKQTAKIDVNECERICVTTSCRGAHNKGRGHIGTVRVPPAHSPSICLAMISCWTSDVPPKIVCARPSRWD